MSIVKEGKLVHIKAYLYMQIINLITEYKYQHKQIVEDYYLKGWKSKDEK